MGNIPKASLYNNQANDTLIGLEEQEHRNVTNAIADILNGAWTSWTPTIAWTGTTVPVLTTVAKYIQLGSTVIFNYFASSAANTGVNVTGLTISLPITPADNDSLPPIDAIELTTSLTYTSIPAYIDMTTSTASERLIRFRTFHAVKTNAYSMAISGMYEVA